MLCVCVYVMCMYNVLCVAYGIRFAYFPRYKRRILKAHVPIFFWPQHTGVYLPCQSRNAYIVCIHSADAFPLPLVSSTFLYSGIMSLPRRPLFSEQLAGLLAIVANARGLFQVQTSVQTIHPRILLNTNGNNIDIFFFVFFILIEIIFVCIFLIKLDSFIHVCSESFSFSLLQ